MDYVCMGSVCIENQVYCGGVLNGFFSCKNGICKMNCMTGSDCQEGYGCNLFFKTCADNNVLVGVQCFGDNVCDGKCMDGFCCQGGAKPFGSPISECCNESNDCENVILKQYLGVNAFLSSYGHSKCSDSVICVQQFKVYAKMWVNGLEYYLC